MKVRYDNVTGLTQVPRSYPLMRKSTSLNDVSEISSTSDAEEDDEQEQVTQLMSTITTSLTKFNVPSIGICYRHGCHSSRDRKKYNMSQRLLLNQNHPVQIKS